MTQEDKELLIKDLCARLPYGVKLKVEHFDNPLSFVGYNTCFEIIVDGMTPIPVEVCKPYLFPMSSMTEEQKNEYFDVCWKDWVDNKSKDINEIEVLYKGADWLNALHFDFRNLIGRKLAIDATNLNIY